MKSKQQDPVVYVAMSGGVDSSVAAALLKKRGFHVVGVFMKPWQDPTIKCLWQKDREDALRVAAMLNIPFHTWDFSKEYERKVTRYMIDAYKKGITPNPDVMCNKEIKFGLFYRRAVKEGADFIATGHYARTEKGKLLTAKDQNKDQTYFLWTLTSDILTKTLFPVGDYTKPQVRKLAKRFGLPVFNKKDSQGVCFIGPLDMKAFLKTKIRPRKGTIMHLNGRMLGTHDGAAYYTIGQRHGLNITLGGGPYFVVKKDIRKNIVYVGTERDLAETEARITHVQLIDKKSKLPKNVSVKIRYRTPAETASLKSGYLLFKKSQRAVTSGQSAVFYKGNRVLGGGIIS